MIIHRERLKDILWKRRCWVCGAILKDDENTTCKFYHRNNTESIYKITKQ